MRKALLILSIMVATSLFNTTVFASVNDDQVTSQKIKEADGTSGQNTNSGSGVKTGHIQDAAVITSKIENNAVTSGKIADGAVTDAKITGPISASKISSTGLNSDTVDGLHAADLAPAVHIHPQSQVTGLEAALAVKSDVTHNHDVLYQQKYGKVAVVAQTGGDYTHPMAAAENVASWCGTASLTNRCLIKIMPGIYDFQRSGIEVPNYVDIEGSGENVTTLLNTTVFIYYHSEVRNLTIETNNGLNTSAIWLVTRQFVTGGPDKVTNVTINISNVTDPLSTVYGIVTQSVGDYTLKDVTINIASNPAPTYGVLSAFSHGKMSGVTINSPSAQEGIHLGYNSTATIHYSTISAAQSIVADGSTARVASTNINGAAPTAVNGGALKCFGLFDDNYGPVTCP